MNTFTLKLPSPSQTRAMLEILYASGDLRFLRLSYLAAHPRAKRRPRP